VTSPALAIRKLGFRKWYERALIESHVYLVTCFLGIILVATSFEFGRYPIASWEGITRLFLGLGGGILSALAWVRYRRRMFVACSLANRATCPACDRYGSFEVLAFGARSLEEAAENAVSPEEYPWMKVRCRKCQHEWGV
jgi:hypothetical protein